MKRGNFVISYIPICFFDFLLITRHSFESNVTRFSPWSHIWETLRRLKPSPSTRLTFVALMDGLRIAVPVPLIFPLPLLPNETVPPVALFWIEVRWICFLSYDLRRHYQWSMGVPSLPPAKTNLVFGDPGKVFLTWLVTEIELWFWHVVIYIHIIWSSMLSERTPRASRTPRVSLRNGLIIFNVIPSSFFTFNVFL